MNLTYGELFAGYGGLGMGVHSVLGGEMAWCAEFDAAPSKILAHHWPNVPNLGDVTKVDWASVPPVDVITGGSPCQDLSHAGKRAGMTTGTRSNLWVEMREAIATIRPRLVVWENVRGAGTAEAHSALEQCPRCVGDPRDRGPVLRALGRVLGDLSDLGYVGGWYGLRAADVGAAHGRFRFFVIAQPADADLSGLEGRFPSGERRGERPFGKGGLETGPGEPQAGSGAELRRPGRGEPHVATGGIGAGQRDGLILLPSPRTSDTNGAGIHGDGGLDLRTAVSLLPTPDAGHDWKEYGPAIRRQEAAFGRPAPMPTAPDGKGGKHRLSPKFSEWLMGLPEGHVTSVPGLSRTDQIKALGNGVVPQQAAAATWAFLNDISKERAA